MIFERRFSAVLIALLWPFLAARKIPFFAQAVDKASPNGALQEPSAHRTLTNPHRAMKDNWVVALASPELQNALQNGLYSAENVQ